MLRPDQRIHGGIAAADQRDAGGKRTEELLALGLGFGCGKLLDLDFFNGIQIGGISALAPNRRHDLARLGIRAMLAGTLANFMTAAIAGFLV